ncbi:ABC transporter substrate-binding protein [Kribbella sindirgiensis]|uniref:ABC transporter substrate-binding protein n=1 Tax=Kribbella sindirgiensis TaxID=1124744 RepID=A0A4R0I6M5_9ACTN|nr:ABC transporter substrate-binding protein [Kribbella sindirgiensis]TCC24098.1 ABC transporter substrate-binding protein [Kribbella sindirgiensis]
MNEAPAPRPQDQYEDVEDVVRYQLTRRSMIGGGAAALTAFLAACSGGGSYSDKPANTNKPVATKSIQIGKANIPVPREQTVIVGQVEYTVFDSFNGMIPNGSPGGAGVELATEPLFFLSFATGKLTPWLATEYKYNDDHTELTLKFDPKAHWNDGKPLGANDFRFTVMALKDRPDLFGGGGDLKEFVKTVEVPDAQTAVVKFLKPTPRFHYNFIAAIAGAPNNIMPEHIWKSQDLTKYKDNPPVRSGPYKLKQAIRNQKMFVWEKDPNYWNKDKLDVKPQYVIFQSTSKQLDQASLAFERAEFDVGSIDAQHATQLANTGYPNLVTTQFHDPNPRVMWLNCDPTRGVMAEEKMHWAINYALDREKIGTSVWDVKVPPAIYPWADYPTNDKWKDDELAGKYKFEYNLDKATQLLDEIAPKNAAGKRTYKGKEINLEIITPAQVDKAEYAIANVLKTDLAKIGVPCTLRSLSGSVHDEKFQRGEYDIDSSWAGFAIDPEQLYTDWESSKAQPIGKNAAGKNKMRFRDPAFDAISQKLSGMDPDSEEAKPLLKQALEIYFQKLPLLPVIQTGYPQFFNTAFWKDWPTDDNLYEVPLNWWPHFTLVLGKIQATGQKGPA